MKSSFAPLNGSCKHDVQNVDLFLISHPCNMCAIDVTNSSPFDVDVLSVRSPSPHSSGLPVSPSVRFPPRWFRSLCLSCRWSGEIRGEEAAATKWEASCSNPSTKSAAAKTDRAAQVSEREGSGKKRNWGREGNYGQIAETRQRYSVGLYGELQVASVPPDC